VTSTPDDVKARELLALFGMPFKSMERDERAPKPRPGAGASAQPAKA
jgi:hypothetical protein